MVFTALKNKKNLYVSVALSILFIVFASQAFCKEYTKLRSCVLYVENKDPIFWAKATPLLEEKGYHLVKVSNPDQISFQDGSLFLTALANISTGNGIFHVNTCAASLLVREKVREENKLAIKITKLGSKARYGKVTITNKINKNLTSCSLDQIPAYCDMVFERALKELPDCSETYWRAN